MSKNNITKTDAETCDDLSEPVPELEQGTAPELDIEIAPDLEPFLETPPDLYKIGEVEKKDKSKENRK